MFSAMDVNASTARRELHRDQMRDQAAEVSWLDDPSLIPQAATSYQVRPDTIVEECYNLGKWMLGRLGVWAADGHSRLHLADTFERNSLTGEERIEVREVFQLHARDAYSPGIAAVSEIVAVVPTLASREGIAESEWGAIASQARKFGALFARDGTIVQGLVRNYLDGRDELIEKRRLDPTKLKLDSETGITTTTPMVAVVQAARDIVDTFIEPTEVSGVCVALQAKPNELDQATMWDAVWDAYTFAAARFIYPHTRPNREEIPPLAAPDYNLRPIMLKFIERAIRAHQIGISSMEARQDL